MQLLKIEKRKGISPLIATLLLIAIAVAASVLTYSWVMSMIGSQSAQAQTQLRIDTIDWDLNTVVVRNTGSVDAVLESISVRPNTSGSAFVSFSGAALDETSLLMGKATPIEVTGLNTGLTAGGSYVVRVTAATGFYYEAVFTVPL
jgi:archaeal type IV pilus assembly protein PilA